MVETVSVIIPCHNAAPYLGEALESIAAQTAGIVEVLLIDDGSTDGSADVARDGAKRLRLDLTVFSVNVRSAAAARNVGITEAKGEWVAFLDADDAWYPCHLEQALGLLAFDRDVAYMANHHWYRGGDVEPIPESLRPKIERSATGMPHLRFAELMSQGFHFGHSTVLYRLDRVRKVGGFDTTQVRRHDIDLWLRVVAGHTWAWGAQPAARYRIDTPGSISKNVIEAQYFQLRAFQRNAASYSGPAMTMLIESCARHAMSLSFVDGTREQYERVRPLAWPYLNLAFRMSYRLASVWNHPLQQAIRVKRRMMRLAGGPR